MTLHKLTEIEAGYVAQGYSLPDGMTWEQVAVSREAYGVGEIYVPIAVGPACVGWGVPMRDGKFLSHCRMCADTIANHSNTRRNP